MIQGALELLVDRHLPAFCVLDPEGLELDWATVAACARHRAAGNPNRYELLIYFCTPRAVRSAGVQSAAQAKFNEDRLNGLFGNSCWRETAELQQAGRLPPNEAGKRYLDLYERQLKSLGYTTVLKRPTIRRDGRLLYHLVFASANDAGRSIMTSALKRAYAGQIPFQM